MENNNKALLRQAFPNEEAHTIIEMAGTWEMHKQASIEGMADSLVARKEAQHTDDLFKLYDNIVAGTEKVVNSLNKLGFHHLMVCLPTGVSFSYNHETDQIVSKPFACRSKFLAQWKFQDFDARSLSFMLYNFDITENNKKIVRGALVPRSVFETLTLE